MPKIIDIFTPGMQDIDIEIFWKWFNDNKDKLESDSYDQTILQQLDMTISNWNLSWEIGPGQSKKRTR